MSTTKYVLTFFNGVTISLHQVAPVLSFWDVQATISRADWREGTTDRCFFDIHHGLLSTR